MLDWKVSLPLFWCLQILTSVVREVSDFAVICVWARKSRPWSRSQWKGCAPSLVIHAEGRAGGVAGERAETNQMVAGGRKCMDCKKQELTMGN